MSNVAVEKVKEPNAAPASVYGRMQEIANRISKRAYELFQSRGATDGAAMDDWLQAERNVLIFPESELTEKDGKFNVRVQVSGFAPKDIHVTAMPDAIIVQAESREEQSTREKDVHYTEFAERELFRRLDLPAPINPDKVTANLEHGVLQMTAEKASDGKNRVRTNAA